MQVDGDAYMNINSHLHTLPEPTLTKIIADILGAKNGPAIESDSDHEKVEDDKIVTKKKALEYINGLMKLISSLNGTANRKYDILYFLVFFVLVVFRNLPSNKNRCVFFFLKKKKQPVFKKGYAFNCTIK